MENIMETAIDKIIGVLDSPDNQIRLEIFQNESGVYGFRKLFKGKIIVETSVGIQLQDQNFLSGLEFLEIQEFEGNEIYSIPGKRKMVEANYNGINLFLNSDHGSIKIEFRIFNDGAAFRYVVPQQERITNYNVVNEFNTFSFPDLQLKAYPMCLDNFESNYEGTYSPQEVESIPQGKLIGMPLLLTGEGVALAITEAALIDYAGTYLIRHNHENELQSVLSPHPTDQYISVINNSGFVSPWRVLMVADSPVKLIESDLLTNLNSTPATNDFTEWVKPGKASWDWWSGPFLENDPAAGMNTSTIKKFIDFSAEAKLEYMLIDAGWSGKHDEHYYQDITRPIAEIDMRQILDYARNKNVGIWLWANWRCVRRQMYQAFPQYQQWGIKGIKVDYMDRDDQEMVQFYIEVAALAAKHRLMVVFHGAHKPTGLSKTYPNILSYEGVRGNEYNKWDKLLPSHNLMLPFTRMLGGPMDFTPGSCVNVEEEDHISRWNNPMSIGTRCHQLAMFVVYDSPFQCLCDSPDLYRDGFGLDFLSVVPTVWDNTIGIAGDPGEFIVIARRSGDKWYVGGMVAEKQNLQFSLNFIGKESAEVELWYDYADRDESTNPLLKDRFKISSDDTVNLVCDQGGGFVMIIS